MPRCLVLRDQPSHAAGMGVDPYGCTLTTAQGERVMHEECLPVLRDCVVKRTKAHGGCLGARGRRRTGQAPKRPGEPQAGCDPGMSEWGNPPGGMPWHRHLNP